MAIKIENTKRQSRIGSVEIIPGGILVGYKNGTSDFLSRYRIVDFYQRNKEKLSEDICQAIEKSGARLFRHYHLEQPEPINSEHILELYTQVFTLISEYKNKSGKPLLILVGEEHSCPNSALVEMIVVDIASNYGLRDLCLELPPEVPESNKLTSYVSLAGYVGNMSFIGLLGVSYGCRLVAIDSEEEVREAFSECFRELRDAKNIQGELGEQYRDLLSKLYESLAVARDRRMAANLMELRMPKDILSDEIDSSVKVAIVGGAHLKGIMEGLLPRDAFNLLLINCTQSELTFGDDDEYYKDAYYFASSSLDVKRVVPLGESGFYDNDELFEMVLDAAFIFEKVQAELYRDELADILKLIRDFKSKLGSEETVNVERLEAAIMQADGGVGRSSSMRYRLRCIVGEYAEKMYAQYLAAVLERTVAFGQLVLGLSALHEKLIQAPYTLAKLNPVEERFVELKTETRNGSEIHILLDKVETKNTADGKVQFICETNELAIQLQLIMLKRGILNPAVKTVSTPSAARDHNDYVIELSYAEYSLFMRTTQEVSAEAPSVRVAANIQLPGTASAGDDNTAAAAADSTLRVGAAGTLTGPGKGTSQ